PELSWCPCLNRTSALRGTARCREAASLRSSMTRSPEARTARDETVDGHRSGDDVRWNQQRLLLLLLRDVSEVGPRCSYGSRGFALSEKRTSAIHLSHIDDPSRRHLESVPWSPNRPGWTL